MMSSHVFLFRHCVRSTDEEGQDLRANVDAALPRWNTPPSWCTAGGTETVYGTGRWIASTLLRGLAAAARGDPVVRVRLVSDTSQRDIDTALAMSLGMAEAASRLSLPVQGLSDIRYDEMLFHPVSDEQYGGIPGCRDAIWQSQVKQVRDRFRSVSPPSPDLAEPLRMLQELGGLAAAEMDPSISLNSNGVFDGAINFVKDAADVAFFTRAGGIDPPYLPGATVSQVYALQEWSNYQQSVLHVGNAHAARKGAVLMEKVIEALASKNDTVTIIVGHDLDMDDVATALGVRWKLPPPYQCRDAEYSPTPPGSAMHFSLDRDTDVVGMSFLYPVYLPGEGLPVNSTGVLDSTPLLFPHAGDAKITSDSEVTYLEGAPKLCGSRCSQFFQITQGPKNVIKPRWPGSLGP